jgi:glycosyltransferase involved in cell wall biosynthesis
MLADELIANDFEVTIITPRTRGGKPHEKKDGLEVFRIDTGSGLAGRIPDPRIAFSLSLRKFKKGFDFTKFDILHIYDVHDSYFLDRKIRENVNTIVSVNDFYSYVTPLNIFRFIYPCENRLKRYIHYTITRYLNKKYIRMADIVLANTGFVKNVLAEKGIADNEKIKVIRRCMDVKRFSAGKNKYSSHEIFYIGNNMERKGVMDIIEALPRVLKRFPDSKLTLVGGAQKSMEKKIQNTIKEHGLESTVDVIPFMPPEDIAKRFSTANVFVLPSIIENLAVTLLEAMASGTPVVCTGTGANTEAVDERCGFIVDPESPGMIAERVIDIFSKPEMARGMGRAGRDKIERCFRKDSMARQVMDVYNTIDSKKSS